MLTLLSERTEEIRRFQTKPWPLQKTFKTPLKELNRFIATFLARFSFEKGTLSTHQVVFEPKHLLQLLRNNSVTVSDHYRWTIVAAGKEDIADLLQAALDDWVDFTFVPCPEVVAIYADHDEYTTFYTRDDATLNSLTSSLEAAGFETVLSYSRGCSGDNWR
ncbi:MAG: hypothetical protein DMG89_08255 [Acidobacteria bacterium]|nr:MAG: hypothetical protein DMG89_08255 [Acidobacteriota bacterium]